MKTLICSLFAFVSLTGASFAGPARPVLSAAEAATIAQADLDSRGLQDTVFIWQITYKEASVMNGYTYWEILWSNDFPAQTEGRNEYALRVAMDGTYKRSVK
jgi:hypothetical protein